jgi:Predicted membrane protein
MKRLPLAIFFVSSGIEIISNLFNWNDFHLFAKPLIMLGLVGHYWINASVRNNLFIVALLCCWAGDVFLMFQSSNEMFFMAGLGSFLLGHILYVLTYQHHRWSEGVGLLGPQKVRFALPIILAGSGLVVVLYPALGGLKIPVMVYALVITVMVLQAMLRFGYTSTRSFLFIFIGALFFMISDSVLAINKFLDPVPLAGVWIMTTYCAAQWLIVEGILHHPQSN